MVVTFEELYAAQKAAQEKRYREIKTQFEKSFGDSAGAEYFSAPGRTELGGNHTDHNHGRVLAGAVDLDIVGLARKTEDNMVLLKSAGYSRVDTVPLDELEKKAGETNSQALVRGICFKCRELGYRVGGFQCYAMNNVLKGSGLSSSAAFEILVVTIISHLYNDGKIDPITAAKISQFAENVYFEKPSGLLDQMASSMGGVTAMDFGDPAKPQVENLEFDLNAFGHALCVVDTGGSHSNLTAEYAAIPKEMKAVAAFFGKGFLREVDEGEFYGHLNEIRKETGERAVLRAMHFFDDDRLAAEEAEAIKRKDFPAFLKMVRASGRSSYQRLQNIFPVSAPAEQGIALGLVLSERLLGEAGACRVHGGGFAGTIQAYVPFEKLEKYRAELEKIFGQGSCHVLSVRQAGGTKVVADPSLL